MALTIRSLSETAENTLLKIQEKNEQINTSSKAIEFVIYIDKHPQFQREYERHLSLRDYNPNFVGGNLN